MTKFFKRCKKISKVGKYVKSCQKMPNVAKQMPKIAKKICKNVVKSFQKMPEVALTKQNFPKGPKSCHRLSLERCQKLSKVVKFYLMMPKDAQVC